MPGPLAGDRPTKAQVVAALKLAAAPGCLSVGSRRCQQDLLRLGVDVETVAEWIREDCETEALYAHEPDQQPGRNAPEPDDHMAMLRIDDGEDYFYAKVALRLPELSPGRLISFHEWTD